MADDAILEISFTQGEDVSIQIFWTDEYGEPVPITDPILMDVKDSNGQIALRFSDSNDSTTQAAIEYSGPNGFFQLTCPSALTRVLVPGRYKFDLFAAVIDGENNVFANAQLQQVISGWVVVNQRTTKIEDASAVLTGGL